MCLKYRHQHTYTASVKHLQPVQLELQQYPQSIWITQENNVVAESSSIVP